MSFLSSSAWAIKTGLIISGISSIMISWVNTSFSINTFTVKGWFSVHKFNSLIGSNSGSIISGSIISGSIISCAVISSGPIIVLR